MSSRSASPFRTPAEREAERTAKREAVLRSAVDLFNEKGFSATSLDDVAARLGVTKPVIYHYLGTKEQVLLECLGRGLEALEAAATEAQEKHGTGASRLRAFLIRYAEVNMAPFGRCVVLTADHELSADGITRFRAMKRRIDAALRQLIADGIADGSLEAPDPALTAATLAGALNWIPRWQDPEGALSPQGVAEHVVETLMRGALFARGSIGIGADHCFGILFPALVCGRCRLLVDHARSLLGIGDLLDLFGGRGGVLVGRRHAASPYVSRAQRTEPEMEPARGSRAPTLARNVDCWSGTEQGERRWDLI